MGKKKAKKSKKCNFASVKSTGGFTNSSFTEAEGPIRGLNNNGNTCFFNSCLQALNAVISYEHITAHNTSYCGDGNVHANILATLQALQKSHSRSTFNPGMLLSSIGKEAPQFKNRRQHDSHELFLTLLSILSDEVVESRSRPPGQGSREALSSAMSDHYQEDPILSHFAGQCGNIVTCLACGARSCSLQNCLDISVHIPGSSKLLMSTSSRFTSPLKGLDVKNSKKVKMALAKESEQLRSSGVILESAPGGRNEVRESSSQGLDDSSTQSHVATVLANMLDALEDMDCSNDSDSNYVSPQEDEACCDRRVYHQEIEQDRDKNDCIEILEPRLRQNLTAKRDCISMYSCLDEYTAPEDLCVADGNGYVCSSCTSGGDSCPGERRDARKRLLLVRAPPVLVLHLKRLLPGGKCSKYVSFPVVLSMRSYMGVVIAKMGSGSGGVGASKIYHDVRAEDGRHDDDEDGGDDEDDGGAAYTLAAVIVHQGGALGGHYISYVKVRQVWYYASDAQTRATTEAEVLKSEAYMLFYAKVNANVPDDEAVSPVGCENVDDVEIEIIGNEKEGDSALTDLSCGKEGMPETLTLPGAISPAVPVPATTTSTSLSTDKKADLRWAKSLKPPELKRELQQLGLSTQGSKKEMLLRLLEASF